MNRRGAVLLTVLGALLLLGALIATVLAAALEESRIARNAESALVARAAAAAALARAETDGDLVAGLLPPGGVAILNGGLAGAAYEARLERSADGFVGVRGMGRELRHGARRDVATLMRLVPLRPRRPAVALLRYPLPASLAGRIDPSDRVPPGWTCGAAMTVAPPVVAPAEPDSSHFALGPVPWPALAAWMGRPRAPDSLAGLSVAGDLVLDGQRRLGILVVDGVLTLRGGAEVVGTVVARRGLIFGPGGGSVLGAVVAESLGMVSGVTPALALVGYSACAVGASGWPPAAIRRVPGLPPADDWR